MTYTIEAGKVFNMVLSHRDSSDPFTWNEKTALEEMNAEFQGWDPTSGKLVILGDAAYVMLPYMSQEELQKAMQIFQTVPMERVGKMQEASLLNGQLWHFADGPLQGARDAVMVPEVEGRPFGHSPNQ
ncbi:hypothetical protein BJX62DRAFT_231505 [Aspergillus germanicus]